MASNLGDQTNGLSQITGVGSYADTGANGAPTDSGFLNPTGAPTSDLNPPSDSAQTGSVGYFPGVGAREDDADLYRPSSFGAHAPDSTGASGSVPTDSHHLH